MWKVAVGFVLFAALALYLLQKSGGDLDLGGEKHDVSAGLHEPAASAAASASAAAAAASAAASAAAAAASR